MGAMWLHDMAYNAEGQPVAGWVGIYALKAYRNYGLPALLWKQVRASLEASGVENFYAGVHVKNHRSQAFATSHMGLHLIDLYPDFTLFGGEWTSCYIYTSDARFAAEGWRLAHHRAQQLRSENDG